MGGAPIAPEIWEFLREHPGQPYTAGQIASAVNKPGKEDSINSVLVRGVVGGELPIKRIARGLYVYGDYKEGRQKTRTSTVAADAIFECIGVGKDGQPIVRNPEDQRLYRLVEI